MIGVQSKKDACGVAVKRLFRSCFDNRHYAYLLIVSFCFIMTAATMSMLDYLSTYATVFGIVSTSAFIIYTFFYLHGMKSKKGYGRVLDFAFAASLLDFIAMFVFSGALANLTFEYNADALLPLLIGMVTMVMLAFSLFLFVYFFRKLRVKQVHRALVIIVMFIAISSMFYVIITGVLGSAYKIDDEIYISVKGIGYLLSGMNPYQQSVAQQLYYNASEVGFTLTTTNQIIGVLNYPALYLFAYFPFCLFLKPTLYNMEHYMAALQEATFSAILLIAIAFSIDKEGLKKPPYGVLLSLMFIFLLKSSMVNYLIIALLIIAYKGMGTKYSWVLLGLCLAIQELAWVPVVLLLAYSFNNYGLKKGIKDVIGSGAVFLAINGYFILLSPSAFFDAIFNPLQKLLLPLGSASLFGFFILTGYHVLLSTNTMIFGIVLLLMIVAYVYTNEKVLLGLFSMVPMFFLVHALASYYTIFLMLIFAGMLMKDKVTKPGIFGSYLRKRKAVFFALVSVLLLALAATVYMSHISYSQGFDLSVSNQSIHYSASPNETVYTGTLSYNSLAVKNVYLLFFIYGGRDEEEFGLTNSSFISNPVQCSSDDIQCLVNVNRITLDNGTGTYQINAVIPRSNYTYRVVDARLMVYNGKYFYIAPAVSNSTGTGP